ncbi:hypothetical protein JCM11251_006891 [Rhodosporidiobolus azoricus]
MPSFSNFRKRASASLDAYTASAAGPLPPHQPRQTRAQRALSRLSRLKIPRRPSQADFAASSSSPTTSCSFSRAQTPVSPISSRAPTPGPWLQQNRPNKLRRQSRSLSVSTVLAFSSTTSGEGDPTFPNPPPTAALLAQDIDRLRDEQIVERLKRTISYPILHHSTAVDVVPGSGWGFREASHRLEHTRRTSTSTTTVARAWTRPSTSLSKRKRSNTASSSFGLTFPSLVADDDGGVEEDPFAPYASLAQNTSNALQLDLDLDLDVSFDSLGESIYSSSSLSSYGASGGDDGPTSRFSTSTLSVYPPIEHPASSATSPAWRESDDSLAEVDLDFETVHSNLGNGIAGVESPILSPFPSTTLYKNQPSVSSPTSSVPSTPTSPLSPFPRSPLMRKPSLAWSTWTTSTTATSVIEEDVQAGRGFSFARTSPSKKGKTFTRSASNASIASRAPILPTPPPTPRLEPVYEDSPSFLVSSDEPGMRASMAESDLSLFLDELAGELEKVQEREGEGEQKQQAASGDLYGDDNARRSSIPFPTFFSRSPAPSPSPPGEAERSNTPSPTPAPMHLFPLVCDDLPSCPASPCPSIFASNKKRHSSAPFPFPFSLDSPPSPAHHARKRVLRRVATRLDLDSRRYTPPSSALNSLLADTPTKSRWPATFLGGGQYSPLFSSATATPRPSTPRLTIVDAPSEIAFPLFPATFSPMASSPLASPKRQKDLVVPTEDSEASGVDPGNEKLACDAGESWTTLSAGVEGGRRRSF